LAVVIKIPFNTEQPTLKKTMEFSDKTFAVLDALHREKISNQRQLADCAGVSLGRVNYILNSLIEKGFVKIRNFKNNPHKETYAYLLTARGLRKKSALAVRFVLSRLEEYEKVRSKLACRLEELERRCHASIVFVGPRAVKELMDQIIEEKGLELCITDFSRDRAGLQDKQPLPGDIVLLFDESSEVPNRLSRAWGVPRDQILPLW
jgi:EPS-associated MarR family transcriptional regulator